MRDPNRIEQFMEELGHIWKTQCPDWRFGQLMFNVQRVLQTHNTDIFYMEDDELIQYLKEWFDIKEDNRISECKYCKSDMEGTPIEDKFAIDTMVDDIFLYNWCKCGRHTVDEINYCPMCGRKLKGEK